MSVLRNVIHRNASGIGRPTSTSFKSCFSIGTLLHKDSFDLVVVGGGSGGLACAKEAADLGKKVAVLDFVTPSPQGTKWDIGGTCVNVGCIPKKLMHQAALLHHSFQNAKAYGWLLEELPKHDWLTLTKAVNMYIRSLNWGHKVQLTDKKVKYINGKGSFVDNKTVRAVDAEGRETIVRGEKIVIAVGGRPRYPEIVGARELCISSDDIFWKKNPPGKTLVVGSSYVGLETAGFLKGLGFDTTLLIRSIPLRGFDQQIAHLITDHMAEEGVDIQWARALVEVRNNALGKLEVVTQSKHAAEVQTEQFDTVLLAIGREALTGDLRLENAGIISDVASKKIVVDDRDATNVRDIYAIGDVAFGRPELTPVAIKAGKLLSHRLFNNSSCLMNYHNIPTTVFTPLEYGCIGMSEEEAINNFGEQCVEVFHAFYKPLEYALPEQNHKQCYIKVVSSTNLNHPLFGIHFLGPNAGEVTQGFAVAMKCGLTYNQLVNSVGIHPTSAEEIVKLRISKRSGLDPTVTGC